jgi:hypothetical protein
MISFVPNSNIRPSMSDISSRTSCAVGSTPRIGTLAEVLVDFFGMSMMTKSSAERSAFCPSRRVPGACLITSTSFRLRPLVISLSAPLRITMARDGEPEPRIAAVKPDAIDSTETNTTTTPAMPTMATPDDPSR